MNNQANQSAYAKVGVDIGAGQRAAALMKTAVQSTFGPEVLSDVGHFGGLFAAGRLREMAQPVLAASTDGVGTKTLVAVRLGRWSTIGRDIVNHCVNDILVQGARPLFFLDYVAAARLEAERAAAVVQGIAAACREIGCALLGGETAEMPGVYQAGALDLAGTVVGVVERAEIIDGRLIRPGDAILGLPSSGLHTNGYTLARAVMDELDWSEPLAELDGRTAGEVLLEPHRCYLAEIDRLQAAGIVIHGLAHITGGGLLDNPPRIFPPGLGARLQRGSWPEPPVFGLIQRLGAVSAPEMFRVFNMGLGMLAVVSQEQAAAAQTAVPALLLVGQITQGASHVEIAE